MKRQLSLTILSVLLLTVACASPPLTPSPATAPTIAEATVPPTAAATAAATGTRAAGATAGATAPTPATGGQGQAAVMKEDLFLPAASPVVSANRCAMPGNLQPGERAATWVSALDLGQLCLFGFADGETVQYEVQDAAGEVAVSSEGQPDNQDGDRLPSVKVMIDIGDKAPGTWTVNAAVPSGELAASFDVQAVTLDGRPAVVLSIGATPTPFVLGQSIPIAAYGLGDAPSVQLGVYEVTDKTSKGMNLKLHEDAVLPTDTGAAFVALTLDPTYQPGGYCLVLQLTPDYKPSNGPSGEGATRCFAVTK